MSKPWNKQCVHVCWQSHLQEWPCYHSMGVIEWTTLWDMESTRMWATPAGNWRGAACSPHFIKRSLSRFHVQFLSWMLQRQVSLELVDYRSSWMPRSQDVFAARSSILKLSKEMWLIQCDGLMMQNWIEEMSTYLKTIDPNHLVTIGSEGFFARGTSLGYLNPQDWAGDMGQDFIANHAFKGIDFSTVHVWPDQWERYSPGAFDTIICFLPCHYLLWDVSMNVLLVLFYVNSIVSSMLFFFWLERRESSDTYWGLVDFLAHGALN